MTDLRNFRNCRLLPLFLALSLVGCGDDKKVTALTTSRSPDGNWAVFANMVQYGGPGTAGLQIEVSLGPARQPDERAMILLLDPDQRVSAAGDTILVNWRSSRSLSIKYPKGSSIDFQAIKAYGLNISADPAN